MDAIQNPKCYYRDDDYLYLIYNDEINKRVVAEVEGGLLVIWHAYYETAIGTQIEFVSNNVIGKRKTKKVTKL